MHRNWSQKLVSHLREKARCRIMNADTAKESTVSTSKERITSTDPREGLQGFKTKLKSSSYK